MRLKVASLIGIAAGCLVGTRAGRQLVTQASAAVGKARRSRNLSLAGEKAKAVIDLGVERARDLVEGRPGAQDHQHRRLVKLSG
jgi:hypothetical protein